MANKVPCTKSEYLDTLRRRLNGRGTERYKTMVSEEISIIEQISDDAFNQYFSVLEGLFNNGKEF
ncbi:transcriptional regulator, TetR family [Kosakonia phage Kc263]|uniref:Transcriptional regulator, TetR family n=1 Tax=Kosakonia phage Kc263 TaxID=2863194 RepID=A0AAE7WHX6_9CAUD|nr:transcriptional regulator, TetR family [Kosakonia phage Kc263]QYN79924.1 transcriptional regulator, TetR family [Kosakonia phage Kc263]